MFSFIASYSKFVVNCLKTMQNFCVFRLTFQSSKPSLTNCAIRCSSSRNLVINRIKNSKKDERSRREQYLRYRKCCQSEPSSHQTIQNSIDDTPLLLTALNAVEILDSKSSKNEDRDREDVLSLLDSINLVAANPQTILPRHDANNYNERFNNQSDAKGANDIESDENSANLSELPRGGPNRQGDNERSYVINIFLNNQKEKQSDDECLNIHIKNLTLRPEDVCVKKLTENISKSYTEIDEILKNNKSISSNDGKILVAKKLEEVWREVFEQSQIEKKFTPLPIEDTIKEDLKLDEIDSDNSAKSLEVDKDVQPKRTDPEEAEERVSDEENLERNPSLIVNSPGAVKEEVTEDAEKMIQQDPIVIAALLDEAIKKNLLYKKKRNTRSTSNEPTENLVERIKLKEQCKLLLQRDKNVRLKINQPQVTPIQAKDVIQRLQLGMTGNEAELIEVERPIPPPPSLKKDILKKKYDARETDENVRNVTTLHKTDKQQLCKDFMDKHSRAVSKKPPSKPDMVAPLPQDTFDPDPVTSELNKAMLEKCLIEEQISKYKHLSVAKKDGKDSSQSIKPETRQNRNKRRKIEMMEVMPPDNHAVRSEPTRPIPLAFGQRLKQYNPRTQKQIQDVISLSAPSQPENTIRRMVTFCRGLFKDEQLTAKLSKFLKQDEIIDRQTRSKRLFNPESTSLNMQYRSFVQPKSHPDSKVKENKDAKTEKVDENKIAPMVRNEEVFGAQQVFQQKCGVRERILPSYDSNIFRGSQRKFSDFRANFIYSKIFDSRININYSSIMIVENRSNTFNRLYSSCDKDTAAKECGTDSNANKEKSDPCSKVDEKEELKSCKAADCQPECEDEPNKCESPEDVKKIESGVVGCTSKCLVNREPNEPAEPDPIPEPCESDKCDPRYKSQVEPVEPKFDIMDKIGQYVSNPKGEEELESYYGDNGYKNLEYFKFYNTSFYDIQHHLAGKRNPQPDPFPHKRAKKEDKKKKGGECKT